MNEQEIKANATTATMKTRSIRASEEVLNKFKEVSESFDNQSDCLEQLITAYELNNSKGTLTDLKADISDFESHINSIQQSYIHILELNSNTEERIRQEFKRQLDSKDNTIIDLQKQISEAKEKVINADAALEEINAKLDDKETEFELERNKNADLYITINQLKSEISQQEETIFLLKERIPETKELEKKVAELEKDIAEKDIKIKADAEAIQQTELKLKASEKSMEIALKETKLNLQEEYQAKIENINAAHNSEISRFNEKIGKLQDKIAELTEKLYNNSDND